MANENAKPLFPAGNYFLKHTRLGVRTIAAHGYSAVKELTPYFKVTHTEDGTDIKTAFGDIADSFEELSLKAILLTREVLANNFKSGEQQFQELYGFYEVVRDEAGEIKYETMPDGSPKLDNDGKPTPQVKFNEGFLKWNGEVGPTCKVDGEVIGRISLTEDSFDDKNRKRPARNWLNDVWAAPKPSDANIIKQFAVRTPEMMNQIAEDAVPAGQFFDALAGKTAGGVKPTGSRVATRVVTPVMPGSTNNDKTAQ